MKSINEARQAAPQRSGWKRNALALALGVALVNLAHAEGGAVQSLSLGAGELGEVLGRFAAEAQVELSFDPARTQGKHSEGLQGRFTVDQGFTALLKGSGLKAVETEPGHYALEKDDGTAVVNGRTVAQLADTTVVASAEETLKQMPGVSIITAEDIQKQPPVNDLSDIIRKMPGVNLTGNSSSGQRGNNRQIDIRGMGPENTLILVDGKPVTSRNAVRYGWGGERDSRGDTNWVPADQVEKIEVIRGPAAARYGSGAMGGVVNIITKAPSQEFHGNLSTYTNVPQDKKEGATKRVTFGLSGPITDALSFRVYGNLNKTENDDATINAVHGGAGYAGREGVRNKDINGLLSWKIDAQQSLDLEAGFSRQGNLYAGDTQLSNKAITARELINGLVGHETNRLYRDTFAITHHGDWAWGKTLSYAQYEHTRNNRLLEGSVGSQEGLILGSNFGESELTNLIAHSEATFPIQAGLEQSLTLGAEWTEQKLDDPVSTAVTLNGGAIPGYTSGTRNPRSEASIRSLIAEDNILVGDDTTVTPGLRMDDHSKFGVDWSPSLNISHYLGDDFTLKTGIARAYKAPNLYQMNPNYLLYSSGNGCLAGSSNGCYLLGNDSLKPEISVNKELGIEFKRDGWVAGMTYFRNDYKNKIVAGTDIIGQAAGSLYSGTDILQWENARKAVVEGVEGTLRVPVRENLTWSTNVTGMLQAINKDTGNPLSSIPRFTINTLLDWDVTDRFSTQLSFSQYGPQKAATHATNRLQARSAMDTREVGTYGVAGLNVGYKLTRNLRLGAGINNLFDKRIYRGTSNRTYNESGRSFVTTLTASF
ncbi:MAG: Ferric enterobactin receptor [Pseudomonas citronellolis]|nr:MAG: Ferric enterobactin receptor [Pseudomonas citronellolis]